MHFRVLAKALRLSGGEFVSGPLPSPPTPGFEQFNILHIQSQVTTMKLVIAN
jgi:hypothetical protein